MNIDNGLQFSYKNFIKSLEVLTKDVEDSKLEQLELDPYPSDYILVQLASKVYTVNGNDSDRDYEKKLELPKGWKLLTTACNQHKTNGYFGAAYWNPSLQQVVIAHRGTEFSNIGAIYTNIMGVLFKNHTSRMSSAITFADKVRTALCKVNRRRGRRLYLSNTGHSLGGWLAQVTTFSLENLQRKDNKFVKVPNNRDRPHVHTVVFDSPGCQKMLESIIDKCDVRYAGKAVLSFNSLDITCYLYAPNLINTCGKHVGTINTFNDNRSINNDAKINNFLSNLWAKMYSLLKRTTPLYTYDIHEIKHFVDLFQTLEGNEILKKNEALEKVSEDKISNIKIIEISDWPKIGREYLKFRINVKYQNNYQPIKDEQESWKMKLRYETERQTKELKTKHYCHQRVFSEGEFFLLKNLSKFREGKYTLNILEDFFNRHNLGKIDDLFPNYKIDFQKELIICDLKKCLQKVINHTKQLMRWFPDLRDVVERQEEEILSSVHLAYNRDSQNYLNSLHKCQMHIKDFVGFQEFLKSCKLCILNIKTNDIRFEVALLHQILCQIQERWRQHPDEFKMWDKYLQKSHQIFLEWKGLLDLQKSVDIGKLHNHVLVVDCTSLTDISGEFTNLLKNILRNVNTDNPNKKIVLISSQKRNLEAFKSFNVSVKHYPRKQKIEQHRLFHLIEESDFLTRKFIAIGRQMFGIKECVGADYNFNEFLEGIKNSVDTQIIKDIVIKPNYMIKIEDPLVNFINLGVNYLKVNKIVSDKSVVRVLKKYSVALLVISGISDEELRNDKRWKELSEIEQERIITTTAELGPKKFNQKCCENLDKIIYWFTVSAESVTCKRVFNKDFYIRRRFKHSVVVDINNVLKFIKQRDVNDLLVFENKDVGTLMNSDCMSKEEVETFLKNKKIHIAASAEEAEMIFRENHDRSIHFLTFKTETCLVWQRSLGTLDALRPYVTFDPHESIEERDLYDGRNKAVIIIGEPGMGKSTSLTNISRLISARPKPTWVIYINLKHLETKNLPLKFNVKTLRKVAKILLTNTNNNLVVMMLENCLNNEKSIQVFLLFDAFDEIKESSERVIELLKFLKDHTTASILVTSRECSRKMLENKLSMFAFEFEMIHEDYQKYFLMKFFRTHLELEMEDFSEKEEENLEKHVIELHSKANDMLDVTRFMGIPLQMRMLATVSLPKVTVSEIVYKSFEIKNIYELYQKFLKILLNIYLWDKNDTLSPCYSFKRIIFNSFIENYGVLSVRVLFPELPEESLKLINKVDMFELCRFGLIRQERGAEFIHHTFSEYFCAALIIHCLDQQGRVYGSTLLGELFISKILLQPSCYLIRSFIEAQIQKYSSLEDSTNFISKIIHQLWDKKGDIFFDNRCRTVLHVASEERNYHTLYFLLNTLNTEATRDAHISLLAALDEDKKTVLSITAENVMISSCTAEKMAHHKIMKKIVLSIENCSFELKEKIIFAPFANNIVTVSKVLTEYLQEADVCSVTKAALDRVQTVFK